MFPPVINLLGKGRASCAVLDFNGARRAALSLILKMLASRQPDGRTPANGISGVRDAQSRHWGAPPVLNVDYPNWSRIAESDACA